MRNLKPIIQYEIYCLKDRDYTPTKNQKLVEASNGTMMIKGICGKCGSKKSRFVSDDYRKLLTRIL